MAENKSTEARRQTRKEYLMTRKQQEQFRTVRLILFGLVGLLVLILAIGAIFEYVVKPGQPVARINDAEVSVSEFHDRVRVERQQTISSVDSLYDAVGGDVAQLQQFAGQQLNGLAIPEVLGEQVLFQMINEELISQEAAARGISVDSAEIDAELAERFQFYDGGLPPEEDTGDEPEPTPTVTPIGAEAEEVVDDVDVEPVPEPTAVSREAFEEQLQEQIDEFVGFGGTEASFREQVATNLLVEKLQDAFADEQGIDTEELQVSLFYMAFQDEAGAESTRAEIDGGKPYLTAWNEIRSAERVTATQPFASELQWTAPETVSTSLGVDVFNALETLEVDDVSPVLADANGRFFIVQLRGREMRPLSEFRINSQKQALLAEWLEEESLDVEIFDRWQEDVPDRPLLDQKYYEQPAAEPVIPAEVQTDQ